MSSAVKSPLAQRYEQLLQNIFNTARNIHPKPPMVELLAVSKTFDASTVQALYTLGQRSFGENYVQEAVGKIQALAHLQPALEWHLIGALQSNKAALAAQYFDWVQTVDRLKIAQRLNDLRPAHLPALNVCIQINVDGGLTKAGVVCTDADQSKSEGLQALLRLAQAVSAMPRLRLRGLLAIPEPESNPARQQAVFAKVKAVFDDLKLQLNQPKDFDMLSLGMSADYTAAIAAGATMVRIGSQIFGVREKTLKPQDAPR